MAETLKEHLLAAGWVEATVDHVLEVYGGDDSKVENDFSKASVDARRAADRVARNYKRDDFLAQLAVFKGELPADAIRPTPPEDENAVIKGGAFLDLEQCYCCGDKHWSVQLTPYRHDNTPYTHWYNCPKNGDPVPMTIEMRKDGPVEINRKIVRDLDEALAHGNFMCAIFFVGKDGKIQLRWHTHLFPHSQFDETAAVLARHNTANGGIAKPTEPLPRGKPRSQTFKIPQELFRQPAPAAGNGEPLVGEAKDGDEGEH